MSRFSMLTGASIIAFSMVPGGAGAQAQTTEPASRPAAETAAEQQLGEIVVMAQRRAQRLQDVPVVVTALDAETLDEKGISSTGDLARLTPGITNFVANGFVMPSLRGIGSQNNAAGSTGTVAVYLDGVYLASPQGSLFSFNNIAQVEVDKGPQGTLFGRNATAGVIQVKTRDPEPTFGGRMSFGIDNYATLVGKLYVTGGLADRLSADIAIMYSDQREGYGKNVVTGKDIYKTRDFNVRSKWLWEPSDNDRITATVDYGALRDSSSTIHFQGIPYNYGIPGFNQPLQSDLGGRWNISAVYEPLVRTKQGGASLEYSHDFGSFLLTNIAAIRHTDNLLVSPSAALPPYDVAAYQEHVYRQKSEELRLSSPESSKIAWTAGIYYLDSESTNEPYTLISTGSSFTAPCTARFCPPYPNGAVAGPLSFGPAPTGEIDLPANAFSVNTFVNSIATSESVAGFAQTTIPVFDTFNFTGGVRYTWEKVGVSGTDSIKAPGVSFNPPKQTFKKFTFKAGVDYHPSSDSMLYATFSRGFQAGFFNANTPAAAASRPQEIDDIEVGFKSSLFDRRVTLNVGGFHYNYNNFVQPVVIAGVPNTTNGPKAKLYGVDVDANFRITDAFQISASGEWLHTKWTSFPNATVPLPASATNPNGFCSLILCNPLGGVVSKVIDATGNELPYAPKFVINVSPSYAKTFDDGSAVNFSASWYHNSGYSSDASNIYRQPAYDLFDAQIEYKPAGSTASIRLWAKNITNEGVYARLSATAPFGIFYAMSAPRTVGATFGYDF